MLVSARGIRFNVEDRGSDGQTLLFLHGNGGDVTNWLPQVGHFSQQHRVISVDLRGFGRSDRTLGAIELRDYAEDILAVLDRLEVTSCVVVGLSLGGMVAQELALIAPDRVTGLLVADSAASLDEQVRELLAQSAQAVLEHGLGPLAEAYRGALFAPATLERGDQCVDDFMAQFGAGDPFQHYLANHAARDIDLLDRIPAISVPTTVLCGVHDQVLPVALSEQIAKAIPGAVLVLLEDAAHVSNLEQPEAFNEAIAQLLARVAAPAGR